MYDDIAASYDALHGAEQRRKLEKLLSQIRLEPGMRVADIGCGTAHLASCFPEQEYVGVDPSAGLLAQADAGVRTIRAAGESVPLEDGSYDVVLSLTALQNYDDWKRGISELFRVARGAVLVGVLKKAPDHDAIVSALRDAASSAGFRLSPAEGDQHDTLVVCTRT